VSNAYSIEEVLVQIRELLRLGMSEQAEAVCRILLQQAPHLAIGWFLLGRMTLQRGSLTEAEAALRQAIALDREQAIYFADLSVALYLQERPAEAENYARRAIALEPAGAVHWLSLGNALQRQGRFEDAAVAYRECVARDSNQAAAWNNVGRGICSPFALRL
jgi:Flp pilus assembly protein TadD